MTRINAGYPVKNLMDKHLIAEHREIKRIPNMILSGKAIVKDIPPEFTLGTGHVKFFYNKLLYLKNRYQEIYNECKNRGFEVTFYYRTFLDAIKKHPELANDYIPTQDCISLITQRIKEKSDGRNLNFPKRVLKA